MTMLYPEPKSVLDTTENALAFIDANGCDRECARPFLTFDKTNGVVTIADDYDVTNDETARDFVLSKNDVSDLIDALQDYVSHRTTSTHQSVDMDDVMDRILRDRLK